MGTLEMLWFSSVCAQFLQLPAQCPLAQGLFLSGSWRSGAAQPARAFRVALGESWLGSVLLIKGQQASLRN